jgi:hypothetical protein
MCSYANLLKRFQSLAGRPLGVHECLFAEIELSHPFEMLMIAVDADRLSIHGLIEFCPIEEAYSLTLETATNLRDTFSLFPFDLIEYEDPRGEVFGGLLVAAILGSEPNRRFASTTITDFVVPRLQTWGDALLNMLRRIVTTESIVMDRRHSFGWVRDD